MLVHDLPDISMFGMKAIGSGGYYVVVLNAKNLPACLIVQVRRVSHSGANPYGSCPRKDRDAVY